MEPFDAQVAIVSPGHLTVSAPLTFATARRVCDAGIAMFVTDGSPSMVMDCSGVTNADSAGLAVLIEWRRWAHHQGRHIQFINLPVQVDAIARLSEVSDVLADAVA